MAVKLLFICTGNICRSPTADGIMRQRVREAGLTARIEVDSAGIQNFHQGDPPDPRSIATARGFGVDISDLRARQVTPADLDSFDIIIAMEHFHARQVRKLRNAPPRAEIRLLMSFAGSAQEVPDPYYDDALFPAVYRLIERGVDGLFDEVRQRLRTG